jgi:hypothetical protein
VAGLSGTGRLADDLYLVATPRQRRMLRDSISSANNVPASPRSRARGWRWGFPVGGHPGQSSRWASSDRMSV